MLNNSMNHKNNVFGTFDYAAILDSQKRNLEVFTRATKMVTDASRDLMTRQAAFAQANMTEYASIMQDIMVAKDLDLVLAKQISFNKSMADKAQTVSSEYVEMCMKTTNEAMGLFRDRADEVVTEFNGQMKTAKDKVTESVKGMVKNS